MAHNITERDGLFVVRTPAWHGLGKVLANYPPREEAQQIAHNWEPMTEPLYRKMSVHVHTLSCQSDTGEIICGIEGNWVAFEEEIYERVPEFDLVVRDDDPTAPPLGVKPDTRSLVTNAEMYDIAEALQGEGEQVKYETGGSLKGGRKVWLLLRFNEPIQVAGRHGTETIPYYALQNAHDGSGAFRGQATMVTIVCDNTSIASDLDAQTRGTEFTFRHTKNVKERIEEAKEALAGWRVSVEAYVRLSEHLIDVPELCRYPGASQRGLHHDDIRAPDAERFGRPREQARCSHSAFPAQSGLNVLKK